MASIIGERHKYWCVAWRTIELLRLMQIRCGLILWSSAIMHAGVITAGGIRLLTSKRKIYLVGVGWISEDVSLLQSSRNRKFATSVIRMVFKPLETFPESFQLSDFNEMPARYNNLRFYFCSHTRIFGEVKLSSSWPSAKITMTSPWRTEKKNRIFYADTSGSLFKNKNAQSFKYCQTHRSK